MFVCRLLGGDIALAFFILGAPASFILGCLADTDSFSRSSLFGYTVLIGEGACFCTYFTTTYLGLYITRALTGFSVGGALPLLSSVLSDWFRPEERSSVMASVGIGTGVGIALGQGISGFVGPLFGWRTPFLIVSVPALIVALLVLFTVVDPVRGGSETTFVRNDLQHLNDSSSHLIESIDEEESTSSSVNQISMVHVNQDMAIIENQNDATSISDDGIAHEIHSYKRGKLLRTCITLLKPSFYAQHWKTAKALFTSRTVLLTMIQGAPGCIPWGIINTFLNDYLSEDCGLSVQAATSFILLFGVGNFFGICIGGMGGDFLYKKNPRYPSLLSGTCALLGCFPTWMLINVAKVDGDRSLSKFIQLGVYSILAGVGSGVTGPIVKATLQNVTLPHARGQAFALLNTFDDFGRGLGPVFVAALIVKLGNRQKAFNIGVTGWLLCGLFNMVIYFTLEDDLERVRREFSETYSSLAQVDSDSM
jgi:MFS family permease